MMFFLDKRFLGIIIIILLSSVNLYIVLSLVSKTFYFDVLLIIVCVRVLLSGLLFDDYRLSWSKASTKTGLLKILIALLGFAIYTPILYYFFGAPFNILFIDLVFYTLFSNIFLFAYKYYFSNATQKKDKSLVIYGAGKAGLQLQREFIDSSYRVISFIDDDKILQRRSIDGIKICSKEDFIKEFGGSKVDLMVIAMPSASSEQIKFIYQSMKDNFSNIKVLPSIDRILRQEEFSAQLKDISVEDLLARNPKDLDKAQIESFIKGKKVLITGAGGSIGSEIARQCAKYRASELILLDHSEYNLYAIAEELESFSPKLLMQSVVNLELLEKSFQKYTPNIVIHAAAYKHVPLVEENIEEAIINNVIGTKNAVDCSIKYGVKKFVLISTDKAVRPTNVMGATKRVCELYAQSINTDENTQMIAVRFGNVLGSSGSVIPKFKSQIEAGGPITVTHPEITRYFMLIPEACELVLQAASLGKGGEVFILDMGEPIKIADLAQKMIELSGKSDIDIVYSGLRAGEKLYEELLIDEGSKKTGYDSIMVAKQTKYKIDELVKNIEELIMVEDKIEKLKIIVPEFNHQRNERKI